MGELSTVEFHGAQLIAVVGATPGETLVAMKPVVEGMGLDWSAQFRRLHRHELLSTCIAKMTIQVPGDAQRRDAVFLPLTRLNFWLATLTPSMIPNAETRARVLRYQEECADVLFAHFFGRATAAAAAPPRVTVGPFVHRAINRRAHALSRELFDAVRRGLEAEVARRRAAGEVVTVETVASLPMPCVAKMATQIEGPRD